MAFLKAGLASNFSTYAFILLISSETHPNRLLMKQECPSMISAPEKSPIK